MRAMTRSTNLDRRGFLQASSAALMAAMTQPLGAADAAAEKFRFRYLVATSMYGGMSLDEILPEVAHCGAGHVDIWASHAEPVTQREMIDRLGHEAFSRKLKDAGVACGCFTHFKLGPFGLRDEMPIARQLGIDGTLLVTGSKGPKGLAGSELKMAVAEFAEQLKPHVAAAEQSGTVIAIENHGNSLIESPDSLRWLVETIQSPHLGIALAPYHLKQNADAIARLIEQLGNRLVLFYAWQYGMGCMQKLPKEQELLQLPGRGPLDFTPIVAALRRIDYQGFVEVFMHPVPRGIPILPTAPEVTAEINRSRAYLEQCLKIA
jgi:sugar phosphate isomerase/epimerase